jgi:hypothetical protein
LVHVEKISSGRSSVLYKPFFTPDSRILTIFLVPIAGPVARRVDLQGFHDIHRI